MIISIIDIGTKSLKHYIFNIFGAEKKLLHYKRYSEVNLGENNIINLETEERLFSVINQCLTTNKTFCVEKIKIVGTEVFRSSSQTKELLDKIERLTGRGVEILDQDKEAFYLYNGFIDLIGDNKVFAAVNIGGGSTEIVLGDNKSLRYHQKLKFGVNFCKNTFGGDKVDWLKLDKYLEENIEKLDGAKEIFITGVLDFLYTVAPRLGFDFKKCLIANHSLYLNIDDYKLLVMKLRVTPIEILRGLYMKDPDFADNVAIGQSVYLKVAEKLGANIVIPSNNDLTDGIINSLLTNFLKNYEQN